jgi:Ser/Thr protein kinase RdoA (MazF antagonist)
MVLKIHFSQEEACFIFKSYYTRLGQISKILPLEAMNVNSMNYVVKTVSQDQQNFSKTYLLRKFGDFQWYHTKEHILRTFDVIARCREAGIKVPQILQTNYGSHLVELNGHLYTCLSFIENEAYAHTDKEIQSVGKNLGELHRVLESLDLKTEQDPFLQELLTQEECEKIRTKIQNQNSKIPKDFANYVSAQLDWLQEKILQNNCFFSSKIFQIQYTHGDFHKGNVLFYEKSVAAILDFDGIKPSQRARELGFAAQRFCLTQKQLELFLESYQQTNPLSNEELEALPHFTIRESCRRASKILRMVFFHDKWHFGSDLEKQITNAKKAESLFNLVP